MTDRYFRRGGRGVFECLACGRSTRLAGQGTDSQLCPDCWEVAGWENTVLDGKPVIEVLEKIKSRVSAIEKKGGDMIRFRKTFSALYPNS